MVTQTPNVEVTKDWTLVFTGATVEFINVEVHGRDAFLRIDTAIPTEDVGVRISEGYRAPNNKDVILGGGENLYARGVDSDTTLVITGA